MHACEGDSRSYISYLDFQPKHWIHIHNYSISQQDKHLKTEKAKSKILILLSLNLHVYHCLDFVRGNISIQLLKKQQHPLVRPKVIIFPLILLFPQLHTLKFISLKNPIYTTYYIYIYIWTLPMSLHISFHDPNKSRCQLSLELLQKGKEGRKKGKEGRWEEGKKTGWMKERGRKEGRLKLLPLAQKAL